MASRKRPPYNPIKPGYWLGFFFWAVILVGVAAAGLELMQALQKVDVDDRFFGFDGTKWLAFLGGWGAIVGALTSARIAIQNTVKQHTITTLLQMRMSETYMLRAQEVSKRYLISGGIFLVTPEEAKNSSPEAKIGELTYVLNYLEFIASAIRYGDLDESLMRESLRGMVCNNFETAHTLIQHKRQDGVRNGSNPNLYEHLEWLYRRWFDAKLQKTWLYR